MYLDTVMEFYLDKENCYAISGDAVVVDTDDVVCKHEKILLLLFNLFGKLLKPMLFLEKLLLLTQMLFAIMKKILLLVLNFLESCRSPCYF